MRLLQPAFLSLSILIILISGCTTTALGKRHEASNPCPLSPDNRLTRLLVYDGRPSDTAILKPEESSETQGYWDLGYVYDAGRSVNIQCFYADKTQLNINLVKRVNQCRYKILPRDEQEFEFVCD